MTSNYQADPYSRRGSVLSRSFLPLALITLGVVFLLSNLIPERSRGGLIVLGLGVAFLIGRVTTGRYGYAVPAGILLAIGTYVSLQDTQTFQAVRGAGLFFVCLGLGFALVYVVGLRPPAVWPLFPATLFIGLGLLLFGVTSFGALASLSWIVAYWPAVLVVLGMWLLFRDHLPLSVRRPVATFGGLALLVYGLLASAASIATAGTIARTGPWPNFGAPPFAEMVTLDQPINPGQTLTINNSGGRTTVHGGSNSSAVHVVATKRFSGSSQAPDVRLTPNGSGVSLDVSTSNSRFPFGGQSAVDYAVDVPAAVAVNAHSSGGQIEIDDVSGDVQADTTSGQLTLTNLGGAVQAHTSSGSIQLRNIAGEVRATTSSGQITGTGLPHLRDTTTTSGSVSLEGVFTETAQIHTSSGAVNLKLLPNSAIQLDARSSSGRVNPQGGLQLTGGETRPDHLAGALGAPAPGATLSITTTSGSITVSQ